MSSYINVPDLAIENIHYEDLAIEHLVSAFEHIHQAIVLRY